jgi:hypothetical protein
MKLRILLLTAILIGSSLAAVPTASAEEKCMGETCTNLPDESCVEDVCVNPSGKTCIESICYYESLFTGQDPCDGNPSRHLDTVWCIVIPPFDATVRDLHEGDLQCDREASPIDLAVCTIEDTIP